MNRFIKTTLNRLSKEHQSNPIIGYLNINSLRNKINDLRKIGRKTQIHVICIDETKLNESFPDTQFYIKGYQHPAFRKDSNKNGGGKIVDVKEGLIAKRILEYENINIEKKDCLHRNCHIEKKIVFNVCLQATV